MTGALDGIVVADFSRVLAGPYATMLLADLGATVVKVERPGTGDDTRAWGPPFAADGQSTYFQSVNRNKASIALDLAEEGDRRIAHVLAARADVLVENHKPGALIRFGLDYPQVRAVNPAVIYCSISGFGAGVGAELPGYDLLVQAMGGLMSITGTDEPTKAGVAVVDVLTGLHAAVGILAALHHRDRTGEGQREVLSRKLKVTPPPLGTPEVIYESGWYDLETDQDSPLKQWRWTAKEAGCVVDNPKRDALLVIRGAVNKEAVPDQKIAFKINGLPFDEFIPEESVFEKTYTIKKEMIGDKDEFILTISVDKPFVPAKVMPQSKDDRELGLMIGLIYYR